MLQWLPWEDAAEMAAVTGVAWAATAGAPPRWAKEATLLLVLYGMWQWAGAWSIGRAGAARARGLAIWDVERALHVPSERSVQQLVLPHPGLVHWLNVLYVQAHVPALGALLVWLFVRHPDRYPAVRTVVVLVTGASLLIQMLPVAPPRLLSTVGVVDTGALIGPSDYAGGAPGIDQLSAMPSLHVGWALIVGVAIVVVSRRRGRWLALAYPAVTVFTVVATGNHYWADGAVAAALCALAAGVARAAYRRRPAGSLHGAGGSPVGAGGSRSGSPVGAGGSRGGSPVGAGGSLAGAGGDERVTAASTAGG
jgi:hypothetical protein